MTTQTQSQTQSHTHTDRVECIPGASLLYIEGDEIVHSLLGVMATDPVGPVAQRAVHIHPTVNQMVPSLLRQLVLL